MIPQRRAVFISTLGSEPQVVTAALDLLLVRKVPVSKVSVLHTCAAAGPVPAALKTLQADFAANPGQPALELCPVLLAGEPVEDVETAEASAAAFRTLYRLIHAEKQKEHQVHLCIAGGRKNLAVFGMVAAQLLFDEADCLWHLYSGGDFLASKRMHPRAGDDVHLLPIPVLLREYLSPALTHLRGVDDPYAALERIKQLDLQRKHEQAAGFVNGALSGAEQRVVALLASEGLGDLELAARLSLSPRTVEQHLRSAYSKAAAHWELDAVNRTQLVTLLHAYFTLPGSEQITGKPA
jgi:CRISPR-associated protein Csx14